MEEMQMQTAEKQHIRAGVDISRKNFAATWKKGCCKTLRFCNSPPSTSGCSILAMQADYLALDRHVGNRINLYREVRIRRTQLDTAARFREITLDRHFPLHQRDHDITRTLLSSALSADHDVAVVDTEITHAFALHPQREHLLRRMLAEHRIRNADLAFLEFNAFRGKSGIDPSQ